MQLSIIKSLRQKKRIRFLTLFCCLILAVVFGQMLIQQPKIARATVHVSSEADGSTTYTFDSATTEAERFICDINDSGCTTNYDNVPDEPSTPDIDESVSKNIVIDGVTVSIVGTHTFSNITIKNNGVLTHPAIETTDIDTAYDTDRTNAAYLKDTGDVKKIDLIIDGSLKLISGGRIDVSGKGYPGGTAAHHDGYGPGGSPGVVYTTSPASQAPGGSHGGLGGDPAAGNPAPVYGSSDFGFTTSVLDFSAVSNPAGVTSNKATWALGLANPPSGTELTTAPTNQYGAIATSNDTRFETSVSAGNAAPVHQFRFYVSPTIDKNTISQLKLIHEGYENGTSGGRQINIWNFSTSSWVELERFVSETSDDTKLLGSQDVDALTIDDYMNANRYVYYSVVSLTDTSLDRTLFTDFASMSITYFTVSPYHGSGGGSIYGSSSVDGTAGGGFVKISAGNIIIDYAAPNTMSSDHAGMAGIFANGAEDANCTGNNCSGAGSGGSIWLKADKMITRYNSGLAPNVSAGAGTIQGTVGAINWGTDPDTGEDMTLIQNFGNNISAAGGFDNALTAGNDVPTGGGGRIKIEIPTVQQTCRLVHSDPFDYIPEVCDMYNQYYSSVNNAVVIDNITIYADKMRIWQADSGSNRIGDSCSDSGDINCDSKRHFDSLTIQNGGIMSHEALSSADSSQDTNSNKSIADEIIGTARWKKVWIESQREIRLDNGKIDVSGKGYPGSSFSACNSSNNLIAGWGPGLGGGTTGTLNAYGAGGGYGGKGGSRSPSVGGNTYPSNFSAGLMLENMFDFGSGGGAGYYHPNFTTKYYCHSGGNGGGRIRLYLNNSIYIDNGGGILANGSNESVFGTLGANDYKGGGGAGGMIWIDMTGSVFTPIPPIYPSISVNGGDVNGSAYDGVSGTLDITNISNPLTTLSSIYANGGFYGSTSNLYDGGGGGGGRTIINRFMGAVPSLTKKLVPIYRQALVDNGVDPAGFNPYALQKDDIIKVEIIAGGISAKTEVTDSFLQTTGLLTPVKCIYDGLASPNPVSIPTATDNEIRWDINSDQKLSYQCKVQ
jgi:hypothetical protein